MLYFCFMKGANNSQGHSRKPTPIDHLRSDTCDVCTHGSHLLLLVVNLLLCVSETITIRYIILGSETIKLIGEGKGQAYKHNFAKTIYIFFHFQTPQRLAKRGRVSQSLKRPSADSSETEPQSASDGTKALPEEAKVVGPEVMSVEEGETQEKNDGAVDGEHACSECGMVFPRRYTLIMHMLKHEKSRSFKCTVRICFVTTLCVWLCLSTSVSQFLV